MRTLALPAAALLVGVAAYGQNPDAPWRTVETAHFRVHYPAPAEPWAMHAASLLEAVRERVIAEVGYAPAEVTDVVVADPVAQANGAALPILGWPRLVLWTSPPGPASGVGDFTDWAELLTIHEETHLVHLLRPSRNPLERLVERLLPLGPIALRAPRWVHEGYATLVEGKLTASGRPNGDFRAAILRQRARAGRLPTYRQMANDSQSWMGMSMAYFAGSAYLEWLAERGRPNALKHLWARMTARTDRSFDAAFEGVFGQPPEKLYERFCAELTWRAMEAERRLAPVAREGELWQRHSWTAGEPAVAPDGRWLVIVLRARGKPSRLVVWSTGPDEEAARKRQERVERQLRRDPQDVAPVDEGPPSRTPLHELVTRNGREPFAPRWLGAGGAVLFGRLEPDAEGFLHPDLFRWDPTGGEVRRLTRLADVRDADPSPDGAWAIAVRTRWGSTQLVRVDLATGAVSEITPPSVEELTAQPRVSPDGARVAFLRHAAGAWKVVVRTLAGGAESVLPTPDGASLAYPAWSPDGRVVYASLGRDGFIDLVALPADESGGVRAVTRTTGAALAPAPTPDGKALFFLALHARGLDVRRIELEVAPPAAAVDTAGLAPAVRPAPPAEPPPLVPASVGPGRAYGLGRQEFAAIVGGAFAPSGTTLEAGVRVGDVVGRLDVTAVGAVGGAAGPRGATVGAAWRGWPVTVSLQLFDTRERPGSQPVVVPGLGGSLDVDRRGAEAIASWGRRWTTGTVELSGGGSFGRVAPAAGGSLGQTVGFVAVSATNTPSIGGWGFPHSLDARFDAGRTAGEGWRRLGGRFEVGAVREGNGLVLGYERRSVDDAPRDLDRLQLGGVESSLLPESVLAGRILVPSLPAGTKVGDRYEGESATLTLGGMPLFYERHRLWNAGGPAGSFLRIAGVAWDVAGGPVPLVKAPGFHATAGVARILDAPFRGATHAWLAVAWRP